MYFYSPIFKLFKNKNMVAEAAKTEIVEEMAAVVVETEIVEEAVVVAMVETQRWLRYARMNSTIAENEFCK